MNQNFRARRDPACFAPERGISLIIVLIMLVVIGLTSASAIRSATSGEKLANNLRMQSLAQQYAEAALRYCEQQIAKGDAAQDASSNLKTANIPTIAYVAGQNSFQTSGSGHWENTASWIGVGGASATRTTLPEVQVKSVDSSIAPSKYPECVAEWQGLTGGKKALVLTARGFSPDYGFKADTGETLRGSVVWLQSVLVY